MSNRLLVFCGGHLMGGQETVTLNYLIELRKLGVEIYCITNAWSNGVFEKELKTLTIPFSSVKLGFIYPRNLLWTLDSLLNFPKALKEIKKVISYFKPNAYYHTSFRTIYMLQAFLRTNHFLHVHEVIENTMFNRHILKRISKKTDKLFAVSNTAIEALISCGVNHLKIELLYNGTHIIPQKKQLKKNNLTLGIVGQIATHKGHDLLLKALYLLKKRNISFYLKIYGTGTQLYIKYLKDNIVSNGLNGTIMWMGFKDNLDAIYSHIDVLLLPTVVEESFGMVIIEAAVRNVLVIASDSGGPAEIIKNRYNGLLFERGNVNDLALKLEEICETNFEFNKLVNNSYDKISAEFDIRKQTEKLKYMLFG